MSTHHEGMSGIHDFFQNTEVSFSRPNNYVTQSKAKYKIRFIKNCK